MEDRKPAADFIRKYILDKYDSVENIRIREMKFDEYTGNWTAHTSFNDAGRSYELALVFKDNKIVFAKEFI
jgi:hypothetical protein